MVAIFFRREKMKKFLSFLLCLCIMLTLAACGGETVKENGNNQNGGETVQDEEFKLTAAKPFSKFENGNGKVVLCFGDSITEGMAMPAEGYTYPSQLQANLNGQYRVINAGVSGETMEAITSRANAADLVLTNDVSFPAGVDKVALKRDLFSYADGSKIEYLAFGNDLPQNRVVIDGVQYSIEYKKGGEDGRDGTYTLVRKDTASKLTLKKGTPVKYDYSEQFDSCHVAIVLMGANGGPSVEERITECKKFAEYYENYIIICPFYGEDDIEKYGAAFGKNVVNPRKYGYEEAHKAYDLEIGKMDEWCISKKRMPATFLLGGKKDECHMSEIGYKLLADVIYQKGVELGYWK